MSQDTDALKKAAALNALIMDLDDQGQDMALTILKSLDFAQTVMCRQTDPVAKEKHPV